MFVVKNFNLIETRYNRSNGHLEQNLFLCQIIIAMTERASYESKHKLELSRYGFRLIKFNLNRFVDDFFKYKKQGIFNDEAYDSGTETNRDLMRRGYDLLITENTELEISGDTKDQNKLLNILGNSLRSYLKTFFPHYDPAQLQLREYSFVDNIINHNTVGFQKLVKQIIFEAVKYSFTDQNITFYDYLNLLRHWEQKTRQAIDTGIYYDLESLQNTLNQNLNNNPMVQLSDISTDTLSKSVGDDGLNEKINILKTPTSLCMEMTTLTTLWVNLLILIINFKFEDPTSAINQIEFLVVVSSTIVIYKYMQRKDKKEELSQKIIKSIIDVKTKRLADFNFENL